MSDRDSDLRRMRVALTVGALCITASVASAQLAERRSDPASRMVQRLNERAVWFEENGAGSNQEQVRFLFRGNRYALALTPDEAMLAVKGSADAASTGPLVRMRLLGAEAREPAGVDLLPGKTYYPTGALGPLTGNRRFRRVRYDDVYPGVDAIYHGDNDRLEFDFVVAPHAAPAQIRLSLASADDVELTGNGDLVVRVEASEVRLEQPVAYQDIDGARRSVTARFRLDERSIATFELGEYDRSHPLVIDPTISFATYIGSEKLDEVTSLETDASGAVYIAGSVPFDAATLWSPNFTSFGQGPGNSPRCYFAKLIPDGSGGLTYDYIAIVEDGYGCGVMAVAPNGDVAVSGPGQASNGVIRLFSNQSGSLTQTATFGVPVQTVDQLRLDNTGRTHAVGLCWQETIPGTVWPLPNGAQPSPTPGLCTNPNATAGLDTQEVLVVADAAGQITYGTFIGTDAAELDVTSLNVDSLGRAWVAGHTTDGLTAITLNAFQGQGAGASDAFLAVFDPAKAGPASLDYASYFGGSGIERDIALVLQPNGRVYLAGNTETSTGFPGKDFVNPAIFLSVLDVSQPPANQLVSTTAVVESPLTSLYSNVETARAIRLLPNGSIAFLADSADSLFPLVQPLYAGPYDATKPNPLRPLLLVYDPATSGFTLATFLDDVQQARFPRVAADAAGSLYVAIATSEPNRSTDASQPLGLGDVLLFAITSPPNQPPTISILSATGTMTVHADSPTGGTVHLAALASDSEGDVLTYAWTGPFIDNPMTTGDFLSARLALGLQQTITVTVDDGHGNTRSASVVVDVIGTPFAGATATPVDSAFSNVFTTSYAPITITAAAAPAAGSRLFLRSRVDQIPPIPSNLQAGSPPLYFDVSTDAPALTAPIQVCVDTSGMSLPVPGTIRLYQHDPGGVSAWTDITTGGYPQGSQLCGQANGLGTFAIFYPQVPPTAITTIAGDGVLASSIDGPGGDPTDDFLAGPATSTPLHYLFGGAYDRANNVLYVSEGATYISRVDLTSNTISRVAGNGVSILGSIDGPGGDPRDDLVEGGHPFNTFIGQPFELVVDPTGNVVFFDRGTCRIRRLDVSLNRVFSVAGNGTCGYSGDGFAASQASLSGGTMAFDVAGHLFLAGDARVRRIDAVTNVIDTVAGDGTYGIAVNGSPALSSIGGGPTGIAFDAQGHLLVAGFPHLLRISPGAADALVDGDADEIIAIVGGCNTNCQVPFGGDGRPISDPQVSVGNISALTVARDGAVLVSDASRIRRITPGADGVVTGAGDEIITTIGGYFDSVNPNFNGDTFSTQSLFSYGAPFVVDDTQGRIMVVDANNYRVRRFDLAPQPVNPNSADLTIRGSAAPDPVDTGADLSYVIRVDNNGPAQATGVTVTHVTPPGVTFQAWSTRTSVVCITPAVGASGTVTCDFGSLASGALNTVTITVRSQTAGPLASIFNVAATEVDSDPGNNSVTLTATVNQAPVVINVAEVVVVSDTVAVLPAAMIGVVETVTVLDTPGVLPSAMIGITETVTVTDTPSLTTPNGPPVVDAGPDQIVEATSFAGASVSLTGVATDADGDPLTLTWSGPCGNGNGASVTFTCALGTHTITFTADDGRGGVVSDTLVVTVRDTTAPTLTLPADITTLPTGAAGVAVNYTATATDIVSGPLVPACSPTSGSTFPVGTTTVTCTATDAAGNQASGNFTVTVPATPAGLRLPGNITALATSASGAVVTYTATLTVSAFGGSVTFAAHCAPPSGSTFPIGTTTVTCTATNPLNPLSPPVTGTFTVTVTVGTPSLQATVVTHGRDSVGFFVQLRLRNVGTGHARNVALTSLAFRTLMGTGTVTYNPAGSGALPLQIGSVDVGQSQAFRVYLNVPPSVRRFAITENGTLQNVVGTNLTFSFGQTVIP